VAEILFEDFVDFLDALNKSETEYLVVGGYAVVYHGYHRTTGDLDIWVNRTEANYKLLLKAFAIFGMPIFDMTLSNFLDVDKFDVFKFGKSPVRIDVLTACKGLVFEEAFHQSAKVTFDGVQVNMIDVRDLIKAKKAAGRYKDLDDIEHLEG